MYLPVIMIDRYGWPGFIAFAVPNVVGCAAFGYIIRIRERSEELVARHAAAMTWFSVITVAYHIFFLVWMFSDLVPLAPELNWAPASIAAIVLAMGIVLSFLPDRDWLKLSLIIYLVSFAAIFVIGFDALNHVEWTGSSPRQSLAWLAPTLCFGFLLCPYLDLTFHRALQLSPSHHAFAVFGVAFAAMLGLTCLIWFGNSRAMLPSIALAHILAQATFTVGAHVREIRLSPAIGDRGLRWLAMTAPLLAAPALYLAPRFGSDSDAGQPLYLRFLVFYGLIFPAYVLLIMLASKRVSRTTIVVFAVTILICLPLYELGFIQGQTHWLVIALAAIVLAAAAAAAAAWRRHHPLFE